MLKDALWTMYSLLILINLVIQSSRLMLEFRNRLLVLSTRVLHLTMAHCQEKHH